MICSAAFLAMSSTSTVAFAAADDNTQVEELVVTGSRIARKDYIANSPISTVTAEALVANSDITLDTYLNTLPQVNPAGTSTSNNPGNGGQSNIDLRGFGANRNVVLVDGRRAMVSANSLTVDLNTIPQALIESIEVITGGAGAAYGADAIAGAVNIKLKKNFEGVDIRAGYSNSTEYGDAEEYQFSAALGGNFADGKGNAVFGFDRSYRESLIKSQRPFSQNATATTSFLPEGALFWSGTNAPTKAALDGIFATYGVPSTAITLTSGAIGFNLDGTLFHKGIFNSPINAQNYRYPIDGTVNRKLYPDLYSYNFDFVNILVSPLDRYSFTSKVNYEFDSGVEVFAQGGWTSYTAATALAPTPFPTVGTRNPANASSSQVSSSLVTLGAAAVANVLVIPVTNPFIPNDLRTLLNSRVGDDPSLVGAGATEPFRMRQRTLGLGLRESSYENTVVQFMAGIRGPIADTKLTYEASVSEGRTKIAQTQSGNLNTQRIQQMVEAADGGASLCAGGFNIFGRQPISAACKAFLEVSSTLVTDMKQQIGQAYVTGPVFDLPAGELSIVLGAEYRGFEYDFDPGSAAGPISGFNTQNPDAGTTSFRDLFGEALIPLVKDAYLIKSLELNLGVRYSESEFTDKISGRNSAGRGSVAYKGDLSWEINDLLRVRGSYQRSIREPNFGELFAGGGSAPQYFDPCSVTSQARKGASGAQVTALCLATGVAAGAISTFVQTPGAQLSTNTDGNIDLQAEEASTVALGLVWKSPWENQWLSRLQGSIDYYNIKIDNAILTPTPNQIVAACYNYYGTNKTYSATNDSCQAILRLGGDILALYDPVNASGNYTGTNGGKQQSSGIDLQFDYGFDAEWLGLSSSWGSVRVNALLTHVLEFNQQDPIAGVPEIDFAGTVSYFGAGLGTSFPAWKATINTEWQFLDDYKVNVRARYISAMDNRIGLEFPGETEFTGTDSIWYFDMTGTWALNDNVEFRLGVNNVFDRDPETYAPNVQSGTDPSTYDVVGRRYFGGIKLRF